jgi:transposase-like protein
MASPKPHRPVVKAFIAVPCPECKQQTVTLALLTTMVVYYRCGHCGFVWNERATGRLLPAESTRS